MYCTVLYCTVQVRAGHCRTPSMEFRRLTSRDAELGLAGELDKLARTGADKTCQQNFAVVFTIFGGGTSNSITIEGATFFDTFGLL